MSTHRVDRQPLLRAEPDDDEPHSVVICDLVSRVAETSIRELPPLAHTIDPDALDAVFERETARGSIAFEYADHDVVVGASGVIEVYPPDTVTH